MLQGYIRKLYAIAFVLILLPGISFAASSDLFIEGQDYVKLKDKIRNNPEVAQFIASDPNKIQVVFFFNYGCHACAAFNQPFEKWIANQSKKKDSKVVIYKLPVSFNAQWKMLAKLYFVMQTLDPKMRLNDEVFAAIHEKGTSLWQEPILKKFFVDHGYSAQSVDAAYNSFDVDRQVKRADELSKAYEITETPDIIVNGPSASYLLNVVKAGNSVSRLFQILDYVIKREAKMLNN